MTVYRTRPLPHGPLHGRYRLAGDLIVRTQEALRVFDEAGRHDGGNEGICYWAGREGLGPTTMEKVVVSEARHGPQSVFVSAAQFGEVARRARSLDLGILAQVHSHPGDDTRHSDGDDDLIVMPFEGMLSLVAPQYGRTLTSIADFSIHQFQNHRWVLCNPESTAAAFQTIHIA